MIVFDLVCATGHRFEGWFGSAEDFAGQRDGGQIACPTCGDAHVERLPSATRINTGAAEVPAPPRKDGALQDKDPMAMAQVLYARLVDEMLARSEDVGGAFPQEARRIHYGEAPERSIRGQASADEHAELVDEGIPVLRLPVPPRDQFS